MQEKVQLNCTHKINMGGKIQQVCSIMILGFRYFLRPIITDIIWSLHSSSKIDIQDSMYLVLIITEMYSPLGQNSG